MTEHIDSSQVAVSAYTFGSGDAEVRIGARFEPTAAHITLTGLVSRMAFADLLRATADKIDPR